MDNVRRLAGAQMQQRFYINGERLYDINSFERAFEIMEYLERTRKPKQGRWNHSHITCVISPKPPKRDFKLLRGHPR